MFKVCSNLHLSTQVRGLRLYTKTG